MERDECRRDVVARSNGGYSKSFEITPMNRVRVRSYIVILNMCLSCTVIDIFSVEYCRDLEIWVRGRSSLLKTDCPRTYVRFPIRNPQQQVLVSLAVSTQYTNVTDT